MKRKVSLSIVGYQETVGDMRALEIAKEIGCDAVDFDLSSSRFDVANPASIYSKSEDEFLTYFDALRQKAADLELEIGQTHGRVTSYFNDPILDENVFRNARFDCIATKALGAPVTVMHNVTTIITGPEADPNRMREKSFEIFSRILPHARENGIILATETFGDATGRNCCDFFGNILEFVKAYNRLTAAGFADCFKICVDTGHSNKAMRFGNPTPADVIRILGGNTVVLHLNDNDTLTDQHKTPLSGTIDWSDVFAALDEVAYAGNYNMELRLEHYGKNLMVETGAFAVKLMKDILHERYGDGD